MGFMVGKSRTSRMLSELVSSITKRSKPKPRPPEIALTGYQRGGRPVITGFFALLAGLLRFFQSSLSHTLPKE